MIQQIIEENPTIFMDYENKTPAIKWKIKQFAGKLKEMAGIALGVHHSHFEDGEFKESALPAIWQTEGEELLTYRRFLQLLGTEVGRGLHTQFWINALFSDYIPKDWIEVPAQADVRTGQWFFAGKRVSTSTVKVHNNKDNYPNWIISDCRFMNEIMAVKDRGGLVIRVVNPRLTIPENEHESEKSLDSTKFKYVIVNDGTLEDLKAKVFSTLIQIKKDREVQYGAVNH